MRWCMCRVVSTQSRVTLLILICRDDIWQQVEGGQQILVNRHGDSPAAILFPIHLRAIPIHWVCGQNNEALFQADPWVGHMGNERSYVTSQVTSWQVLEFVSRLSDSRTLILNLVCTLTSTGELLRVQMPRLSSIKPEPLKVGLWQQ